ncbi:major facilitator superfamily domain-containing protein [Coprinopsis sp. MPI-PUGE-AT-0042]|nr:major facilitator superfamily domain-containing protein [Coprinopsis sp. MPI-PUGE-AT-0042]
MAARVRNFFLHNPILTFQADMPSVKAIWNSYSRAERRNICIYIAGIMCYKLGFELFHSSIATMATERFHENSEQFAHLGAASGVNQAAQCVGAILIAPLVKRWPTRTILAFAILLFALMTSLLLIIDKATGGDFKHYGSWHPNVIYPIWTVAGITYGMVELIRRVIPVDIVGGDVNKLRRMDAAVHIFYEIAGTIGAIAASRAIQRWGVNYSYFLTPVFFTIAGAIWLSISALGFKSPGVLQAESDTPGLREVDESNAPSSNYIVQLYRGFLHFGESVWVGGRLIFGNRAFIWLPVAYSLAFYLHRFLELTLAQAFARKVLEESAWAPIMVGGSNLGELFGALAVLLLSDTVPTPLPWLRLDALALNIVWVLPAFAAVAKHEELWAWRVAACFIPISMGWAAGDVSLAAYIQATLANSNITHNRVSVLGAVMAFLYSTYIGLTLLLSPTLGIVIDEKRIQYALQTVGGAQYSVACGAILLATFVPKGAFSFNPQSLGGVTASADDAESEEEERAKNTNPLPW